MQTTDPEALVQAYLEAFRARDLARCVEFFTKDAAIHMPGKVHRGKDNIEKWHKARFAANLRILRVDGITAQGETVIVDGVASSDRLRAWDMRTVGGRATLHLEQEKIKEAKFGLRLTNPFKGEG